MRVGEEVVAHQAMYNSVECILQVGRGVKMTALRNAVLCGEDRMGSIGPHNPGVVTLTIVNENNQKNTYNRVPGAR